MKIVLLTLLLPVFATAQNIQRCDSADGKVSYAEHCASGSKAQTVAPKQAAESNVEAQQKRTDKAEADFQKRHLEREKLAQQERASQRKAASQAGDLAYKKDKLELSKIKEKRLGKEKQKQPRSKKQATPKAAKSTS
jgi:hypothetical protein